MGGLSGTVPSAFCDGDTHDRAAICTVKSWTESWAGCLVRYSVLFAMTTRTACCYLHGKSIEEIVGGLLGTVLSALVDDDTHDGAAICTLNSKREGENVDHPFGTLCTF